MKILKQALRMAVLVMVLVFAAVGLGIGGAIMPTYHRKDSVLPAIELVEEREEEEEEEEEQN